MTLTSRLALREDGFFYRQIGYLVASGASLHDVMKILGDESEKIQIRRMAQSVSNDLEHGVSIAEALSAFPVFFNKTLIYMLSQKHDKEKVSDFFYAYADEIERSAEIRLSLVQTLIYPTKILLLAILLILIVVTFVLPVFSEMFFEFRETLPLPTRYLIKFGSAFHGFLPFFIAMILALLLAIIYSKRTLFNVGRWIPGIKILFEEISVYTFAKFLSLLLPLERPFTETIQHSANMVPNVSYRNRIMTASEDVTSMELFKLRAKENRLFPNIFLRTLEISQHTRNLDKQLTELARYYDRRITKRIEIYNNFIETASIVMVGILVGSIAVSLYLPIFKMAGSVS